MTKIHNLILWTRLCDKYDLVKISVSSEMIHWLINYGGKFHHVGDISAPDFIIYDKTFLVVKLLASHFFIIKISSTGINHLNKKWFKIVKKSHTENGKIFSDGCRLSFMCKLCISRKLFPYSENKI